MSATDDLWGDRDIEMAAASKHRYSFEFEYGIEFASENLRRDRDILMAAVKLYGLAI